MGLECAPLEALGRRTSAAYEDGNGQAYAYDLAGQVTHSKVSIANPAAADPTQSPTHTYSYDPAGNCLRSAHARPSAIGSSANGIGNRVAVPPSPSAERATA